MPARRHRRKGAARRDPSWSDSRGRRLRRRDRSNSGCFPRRMAHADVSFPFIFKGGCSSGRDDALLALAAGMMAALRGRLRHSTSRLYIAGARRPGGVMGSGNQAGAPYRVNGDRRHCASAGAEARRRSRSSTPDYPAARLRDARVHVEIDPPRGPARPRQDNLYDPPATGHVHGRRRWRVRAGTLRRGPPSRPRSWPPTWTFRPLAVFTGRPPSRSTLGAGEPIRAPLREDDLLEVSSWISMPWAAGWRPVSRRCSSIDRRRIQPLADGEFSCCRRTRPTGELPTTTSVIRPAL